MDSRAGAVRATSYLPLRGVKDMNAPTDWISVEERLPPQRRPVIVPGGVAVRIGSDWRTLMELYACTEWSDALVIQWDITHWMPIPEGPPR